MNPFQVLVQLFQGVASRVRNLWFRLLGVQMSGYVWLRHVSIPRNWGDITIEKEVALDDDVVLLCTGPPQQGKIVIRSGTYVNRFTMFDASEQIEVGRNCMIGPHCYITDHDHGHRPHASIGAQPLVSAPVRIGDNVWIGAGAIVLKGVTVGDNAVIAAGAVVTREVPPHAKVGGIPAAALRTAHKPI